jgi:hypothetical protein
MQIGESTAQSSGGGTDSTSAPPRPGKLRLWIVDPRGTAIAPGQALPYKVLDGSGSTLASGNLEEGYGYVDIDKPDGGDVSLWLDGEVLTVHTPR